MTNPAPKILYLVHDLNDPGVHKRVAMLRDGGARVVVGGFHRGSQVPAQISVAPAFTFGQTHNGKFVQRLVAVFKQIMRIGRYRADFADADIIIARNLEMLALAVRGRAVVAPQKPVIVYEVLDIHRLLLNDGPVGMILRRLEGSLAARAVLLLTSSPAFVEQYFKPRSCVNLPTRLVENKVYDPSGLVPTAIPHRIPGPPWVIGWFGAIRCATSLRILKELVTSSHGQVRVVIRGRPAYDQFENFDRDVTNTPGLEFLGPYKNPDDLAAIYSAVHFTWAIDYFEKGLNSSWLLPNRIYEGGAFGSVPIALAAVATGQLLKRYQIGAMLDEPLLPALQAFFGTLTSSQYQTMADGCKAVPRPTWVADTNDARDLVTILSSLKGPAP
jgi:succinoglycan biosynthesis protein ExoL